MSQPDPRSQPDNLGTFFAENKTLVKEYLETRLKIYRLQSIRLFSRSAGYFAWIIISVFLAFLFLLFGGLVLGFWFSGLTGSFVEGFGLVAFLILAVFILLAIFRKALFVNPVIQSVIQGSKEEEDEESQ